MAACSVRDDDIRISTTCIQNPDEWDKSSQLILQADLVDRLHQLKNTKPKKKIIVKNKTNFSKKKTKPARRPSPVELDYPTQRPSFNQQPTSDPVAVSLKTWRPAQESPSYNKLSILTQQESLPIIKSQFQANLNRLGSTTVSPDIILSEAELASKTSALISELLKLNQDPSGDSAVAAAVPVSTDPATDSTQTTGNK